MKALFLSLLVVGVVYVFGVELAAQVFASVAGPFRQVGL